MNRARHGHDVVTPGEIMAMFVAEENSLEHAEHFRRRLAGAELNVSVGLARLGHRVGFLGAVGADPLGTHARRTLEAEGVDAAGLTVDPAAGTGFQLKNRVAEGDPTVVYFRRASAGSRFAWSESCAELVGGARHLHLTGVFAALSASTLDCARKAVDRARAVGATVSFDPNLRPALWSDRGEMVEVINELAERADWVLPGLDEGEVLTGAADPAAVADFYLCRGVSEVVIKLGGRGAELHTPQGSHSLPAHPVEVVDTVGAGDGFAAGWISARLDGLSAEDALRRACEVGARATTSRGDMDGLPTRRLLEQPVGA
ncbi:sugar kinase [Actinopolyspora sp. BKK1]|nr:MULTISPECIES: sugar kinase [unclassified Actinopolyspora]NHD18644.1 sugar kinase [Actinopolyspora sp. BKK2]NHE78034.1 sugar kinase [Actinopolyspora sp. BKK1]